MISSEGNGKTKDESSTAMEQSSRTVFVAESLRYQATKGREEQGKGEGMVLSLFFLLQNTKKCIKNPLTASYLIDTTISPKSCIQLSPTHKLLFNHRSTVIFTSVCYFSIIKC